jgi:hypothetical protein
MQNLALKSPAPPTDAVDAADRDAVLARYRRYRALSREHNNRMVAALSADTLLKQARRLGLASGRTLVAEDIDELFLAFDLAIHTAPPDRTRVIDRYARSAKPDPGSDDERVIEAMRRARFTLVRVERRHETAGLIVHDMSRAADLWLMDEQLQVSANGKTMLATRLFDFDDFHITAGVIVPVDGDLLRAVLLHVPFLASRPGPLVVTDRRFAEAVYRVALEDGIMSGVGYRDVDDGEGDKPASSAP